MFVTPADSRLQRAGRGWGGGGLHLVGRFVQLAPCCANLTSVQSCCCSSWRHLYERLYLFVFKHQLLETRWYIHLHTYFICNHNGSIVPVIIKNPKEIEPNKHQTPAYSYTKPPTVSPHKAPEYNGWTGYCFRGL